MQISIHSGFYTNETGLYQVWFENTLGQKDCRNLSEEDIFNLLSANQYHRFEGGESDFNVKTDIFYSI